MKYFIDTEFIEGFWHAVFYKKRHFIDLISIGIVAEDGRELYLISNEYNYGDASEWVKKNVIEPMYLQTVSGDNRNRLMVRNFHKTFGISNKQIMEQVSSFVRNPLLNKGVYDTKDLTDEDLVEFYGYYADYDWVVFCSLFGRMIDLPKYFPMYCRDLKQMLDELYVYQENKYINQTRLESWLKEVKWHPEYPKQKDEHNALSDAKWNKELYDFINQKKFLNTSDNKTTEVKKI